MGLVALIAFVLINSIKDSFVIGCWILLHTPENKPVHTTGP